MPKWLRSSSRSSSRAAVKSTFPYHTDPLAGSFRPIRWRKSVLFPHPLPPMMKKMSPRRTLKVRSRITTKSPNAMVRSLTSMCDSRASGILDAQHVGDDGQDAVEGDDPHDTEHDRRGGRLPDRRGVATAGHSAHAPGERHQDAEDQALADAEADVEQPDRPPGFLPVQPGSLAQHADPDRRAAQHPDQVGVADEQRH